MAMNLCLRCADILIQNKKIPPDRKKPDRMRVNCDNCGAFQILHIHKYPKAKKEYFRVEENQNLGAPDGTGPDERLMKRAMELHRTIKEKNKIITKLEKEKVQLLEENRYLRIRLEISNGNPYSKK